MALRVLFVIRVYKMEAVNSPGYETAEGGMLDKPLVIHLTFKRYLLRAHLVPDTLRELGTHE